MVDRSRKIFNGTMRQRLAACVPGLRAATSGATQRRAAHTRAGLGMRAKLSALPARAGR